MKLKVISICLFLGIIAPHRLMAQAIYVDVAKKSVYGFLDEMANENLIVINQAIKPYTRQFVAEKLNQLKLVEEKLNARQRKELGFYLRDFGKELYRGKFEGKRFDVFYYNDSVFTFSLNGILGGQGWKNQNGTNYHRYFGAEFFATAGNHLGIYASLRDNTERFPLSDTGIITTRNGAQYRGGDYSEMRGGISWAWKWGTVALVKDHAEWGTSYRYPSIISSKAPSFAQLKLQIKPVKWFEFNYLHGWLVSEIVDSSRSYNYNGIQRNVFHNRNIAANMFTFIPWQKLNLSFGNSVVYSDQYFQPAYFIPVLFFKSVDHTYNGATNSAGQNSQMFFDISSRLVRKTHMYYSMFIDVMSFETVFDEENHANHWSMLGGIKYSNLLPNLSLTFEYIRNNPFVYKNDTPTTLYNSNWYNLGHYLNDNAREIYVACEYKAFDNFELKTWYSKAQKGPDYKYVRNSSVLGAVFMEIIEWDRQLLGFRMQYQPLNDLFVFIEAEKQFVGGDNSRYSAEFYQGNTLTWSFGLTFGFY